MKGAVPSSSRIPGLDGLRGIAALIVLLAHMSSGSFFLFPGGSFLGIGRSGVVLFFILSSFLLTSQVLDWPARDLLGANRWLRYLEARILRIWPLYLFVLVFCVATTYLQIIPVAWRAAPLLNNLPFPMTLDSLRQHLLLQRGMIWR